MLSKQASSRSAGRATTGFAQNAELLAPGRSIGDSEPESEVYAEVACSLLQEATPSAEKTARAAETPLKRAAKLELIAKINSLIGAAVTTSLALEFSGDLKTSIAAVITLVGGIIAVWSSLRGPAFSVRRNHS